MRFLTILFLGISFLGHAQSYQPFPTGNASWIEYRYHHYGFGGGNHHIQKTNLRHDLRGDTTINNLTYKKVYYSARDSVSAGDPPWSNTVTNLYDIYAGAIREDSEKRVFVLPPDELNEQLLYDFNLSIGDTIPSNFIDDNLYPNTHFTVGATDSMQIGDNYHKTYEIIPPNSQYTTYSNDFEDLQLIKELVPALVCFSLRIVLSRNRSSE